MDIEKVELPKFTIGPNLKCFGKTLRYAGIEGKFVNDVPLQVSLLFWATNIQDQVARNDTMINHHVIQYVRSLGDLAGIAHADYIMHYYKDEIPKEYAGFNLAFFGTIVDFGKQVCVPYMHNYSTKEYSPLSWTFDFQSIGSDNKEFWRKAVSVHVKQGQIQV